MRTLLFVPASQPGMIQNAMVFGADAIIFDLEDSVAPDEKEAARKLLDHALQHLQFKDTTLLVRINGLGTKHWKKDIETAARGQVDGIVVPKTGGSEDVDRVEAVLTDEEGSLFSGSQGFAIVPILENALGVEHAFRIAASSTRIVGLFLGAEDYAAEVGMERTVEGREILYARSRVAAAAASRQLMAIDTPFVDVDDLEGLERDSQTGRELGFTGRAIISPKHVEIVNRAYSPTEQQKEEARRIVAAADQAARDGKGAVSLDGRMVDPPIVKRAQRILAMHERGPGLR